jgi:hypothetical protein
MLGLVVFGVLEAKRERRELRSFRAQPERGMRRRVAASRLSRTRSTASSSEPVNPGVAASGYDGVQQRLVRTIAPPR